MINGRLFTELKKGKLETVLVILSGLLSGFGIYRCVFKLNKLSPILYQVNDRPDLPVVQIIIFFLLPAALLFIVLYGLFRQKNDAEQKGSLCFAKSLLPTIFFSIFIFTPGGYWVPFLFALVTALTIYRISVIWPDDHCEPASAGEPETYKYLLLLGSLCLIFAAYGVYMQKTAFDVMYLTFNNWGSYVNVANNTLHGNWFINDETNTNFLTGHFSPATFSILTPFIALFPSVDAVFVLNSALLYANPLLLYLFARKIDLSQKTAFLLGFAMLFSPSLANMNLTLFYGFHSITLFMPLLLLFFIFFEKKKLLPAFIIFAFSLFIKETIPIFWVGLGIVLFLRGNKKSGVWMALISLIYWIAVIKFVQPWMRGDVVYDYVDRFDHLGSSITEIALSPILRPGVFFHSLFRERCFFFILSILLPVFYLTLSRPLLLLGATITVGFICLQSNNQFITICLHYQAETVILVYINAVLAAKALQDNRPSPFFKWMRYGMKIPEFCKGNLKPVLNGTIATAVLSWFFLGQNAVGKYSFSFIERMPDMSREIDAMKKIIPAGVPMNATMHTAAHFLLRNKVCPWLTPINGNYFVMDLRHGYHHADDLDRTRYQLLASGHWKVIYAKPVNIRHFIILKEEKNKVALTNLPVLSDTDWQHAGKLLPAASNPDFSVRSRIISRGKRSYIRLALRLNRKVDYDLNMEVVMFNHRERHEVWDIFGRGVIPAFMCQPGSVYAMDYLIPETWEKCTSVTLNLSKRPPIKLPK